MDYYLKAETEEALWTALVAVNAATTYSVKDEEGNVIETKYAAASGYDIDIIGTIYKPTGNTIRGEQGDYPEVEALEGFHANIRGPANLAPVVTYTPYTPTEEELADPEFVMPEPTRVETPSPIASLLVYPTNPVCKWF